MSPSRVVGIHALRNAMIPVITTIGLQVGTLLAGAILTETIFSWPGIGKWMVDSIFRRDYPSVQGGLLLIAVMVMLVNLIVDLLYGIINPRIRHARWPLKPSTKWWSMKGPAAGSLCFRNFGVIFAKTAAQWPGSLYSLLPVSWRSSLT